MLAAPLPESSKTRGKPNSTAPGILQVIQAHVLLSKHPADHQPIQTPSLPGRQALRIAPLICPAGRGTAQLWLSAERGWEFRFFSLGPLLKKQVRLDAREDHALSGCPIVPSYRCRCILSGPSFPTPSAPEVSRNMITPPETPESCSSSTSDPRSLLAAFVPKGAGTCRWSEFSRGQAAGKRQCRC